MNQGYENSYGAPNQAPHAPQPQPVYYPYPQSRLAYGKKALRPPRDPRLRGASHTLNLMGGLVLCQTLFAFAFQSLFALLVIFSGAHSADSGILNQLLSLALVPLSTALPFFLYLVISKDGVSNLLRFEKVGFWNATLCVVAGLSVCLLANFPSNMIQEFFRQFGYEPSSVIGASPTWNEIILEFFCTALVVPVMEEFAFRGVLASSLKKYGIGFAIVGSSFIFALVHMDFANVVFAFIAGLVFGFLYFKTGNLWVPIAIHALNNAIAVITTYSSFFFGKEAAGMVSDAVFFTPIAFGVLAGIILLIFKRSLFITYLSPRYDGPKAPLTPGESVSAMVRSPVLWILIAMMVTVTASLFW